MNFSAAAATFLAATVFFLEAPLQCDAFAGSVFRTDYLKVADVRTDPILSQTCLTDHVHSFYGPPLVYPKVSYNDLRNSAASAGSGNVEQNKSLYWHPAIVRIDQNGNRDIVDSEWTTIYYEFVQGETIAFPDGFRMIGVEPLNAFAECVDPQPCDASTRGTCATVNNFFPSTQCSELEVSMQFPHCWDGATLDTPDQSHVTFSIAEEENEDGTLRGTIFDRCPDSHPVRLPQLSFFFRIFNYDGGPYEFSDGSGKFHADYISGWDATFLQQVLDNCGAANDKTPCTTVPFTHRNNVVYTGNDEQFRQQLQDNKVPLADTSCITTEPITGIPALPRGTCTGTLISPTGTCGVSPTTPAPTQKPVSPPTPAPTNNPTARVQVTTNAPTAAPQPPTPVVQQPTNAPTRLPTVPTPSSCVEIDNSMFTNNVWGPVWDTANAETARLEDDEVVVTNTGQVRTKGNLKNSNGVRDLSAYASIKISFEYSTYNYFSGAWFGLEIKLGQVWTSIGAWVVDQDFVDGEEKLVTLERNTGNEKHVQFRFSANGDVEADSELWMDNIRIEVCT